MCIDFKTVVLYMNDTLLIKIIKSIKTLTNKTKI